MNIFKIIANIAIIALLVFISAPDSTAATRAGEGRITKVSVISRGVYGVQILTDLQSNLNECPNWYVIDMDRPNGKLLYTLAITALTTGKVIDLYYEKGSDQSCIVNEIQLRQ